MSPYPYQLVKPDQIPERRTRSGVGKWAWFRKIILCDLETNGEALRITVPNKREAELAQAAAQNCSSAKTKTTKGHKRPFPDKIKTAKEPVDPRAPGGAYYVYVQVYTP